MMVVQMFNREEIASVVQRYKQGERLSQILRDIVLRRPDIGVPDLMMLLQEAFSLPSTTVHCIGGWWHDGTSELSDEQLDAFLIEGIEKTSRDSTPSSG
jgi:hypothetical protein